MTAHRGMEAAPSMRTGPDLTWARGLTDPADVRRYLTSRRETMPTRRVWRGRGGVWELPAAPTDLSGLPIERLRGRPETFKRMLETSDTDGIAVVHRGHVVHEYHRPGFAAHDPHLTTSMTKSVVGLAAAILVHDGVVDRRHPASRYVPEAAGTAFGDARVDDLLHMSTRVSYSGRIYHRRAEAQRLLAAVSPSARPFGYTGPGSIREHLATARATGPAGAEFRYENGNVEMVAEVLRRATGTTLADLVGELVWSRIGAEEDGYFVLDSDGTEMASGGFCATLRDVARLGEVLRCGGALGGRQALPAAVVTGLGARVPTGPGARVRPPNASPDSRSTLSYRDYWWVLDDPFGSYTATGIHGQMLFVSPGLELVVALYGSRVESPSVPAPAFVLACYQIGAHLGAFEPVPPP
ncbi:amide hydrolase [Rhodococcus sp. ENV425]|uniref:serine hydrolase domain-containing protein n=2 Tax=Nocardiaceae TaxID=85025 RepID=UPI00045CF53B|nr:serine hydrolase [Rhodococcus aetherivorans]KDE11810.1 amide hydrolase [Rhodococcus aetherivorans]MBC2589177.1 serine hydrolase [Rhodococcus aetherivorans]MDV6294145.1 serine hydrolase [Rhodococcus aetherivorans]PND49360.1 amide hydrolase [Rhodococcus sp. ENV425]